MGRSNIFSAWRWPSAESSRPRRMVTGMLWTARAILSNGRPSRRRTMQLVELDTPGGKKVWVNPEHVITVTTSATSNVATDIHLAGALGKAVTVKGTLVEVT